MKKFIFLLTIFIGAGMLILLSFSREERDNKEMPVNIDFSEWAKLYSWDGSKKDFSEISLSGAKSWPDKLYLYRFSPIDGIYYQSEDKQPFVIEKKWALNIVTFGSGLFVCNIQTGLEKYEFRLNDITLTLKKRGSFFVDTTEKQIKIFPFNTFLHTELVNGVKRTHIANFTLFPSLLFKHNPENTLELKGADILRISIIDSIRYVDIKTMEDSKTFFSWDKAGKGVLFLKEVQKSITARIHAFLSLYASIIDRNSNKIKDSSFFDTSSALLINGSKKEILLKNILVENIVWLLGNPSKLQYKNMIHTTLSEMKELDPKSYNEGLSILKQYYYIATFSHFISKNNTFDFWVQESPLLLETEKIITNNMNPWQEEHYTHLSDLFSVYYFLTMSQEEFNNFFEDILQKILDSKVLTKDEFFPFAFFVTQYLSTGPVIPNEDTMLIISHLFQITNDYYGSNTVDKTKIATITSTTFYNYTKIFTKIYTVFLHTFIDQTPEGFLLKKEYLEWEETTLKQGFIETFTEVIGKAKKDIETKKNTLYSEKSFQSDSQITDSYTLLRKTLESFTILISMFNNYPKYLNDSHLSADNKSIKGIFIDTENQMSKEKLETYLKKFNNIDISTLQILNSFEKDGFYEFQVTILGRVFNLKLWQSNHIIGDISYTDTSGKRYTFPNITVSLDEKEVQMRELIGSSDDPAVQYRYDFKNFFEITFLEGSSTTPVNTESKEMIPTPESSSTIPEIRLFIQKELLEKDFKNIVDFLSITYKNIDVSINEGSYIIKLSNIEKTFVGDSRSYFIELDGSYLFTRHSFSRLSFTAKRDRTDPSYEFDGVSIEILPARISLFSFTESLKDLGYYLDAIKLAYVNQKSIIIDLTGKRVLLDQVPLVPKFPVQ